MKGSARSLMNWVIFVQNQDLMIKTSVMCADIQFHETACLGQIWHFQIRYSGLKMQFGFCNLDFVNLVY